MTTAEKIALAKSNNYFTLFKEGLFYKCYNEDAMVFVKNVKEYKVSEKFVKSMGKLRFGYVYEWPMLQSYLLPNQTHEFMVSMRLFGGNATIW